MRRIKSFNFLFLLEDKYIATRKLVFAIGKKCEQDLGLDTK
jgi:hypothetical protein